MWVWPRQLVDAPAYLRELSAKFCIQHVREIFVPQLKLNVLSLLHIFQQCNVVPFQQIVHPPQIAYRFLRSAYSFNQRHRMYLSQMLKNCFL